ncbi:hypothetical protein ACHAW6_011151 [Cyclotella cf. meneghiniana]
MSLPFLNISLRHSNPTLFAEQLLGFFLIQHDISEGVCETALNETAQFFRRPLPEKMTISYENNAAFRGYMPLGVENTEGKIDQREQVEYAAEYKDSHQHKMGEISFYHRLRSTNPWPGAVQPSLRPAIMEYVRSVLHIAEQLRESMCLAMNINPQEVDHLFGPCDGTDPSFWSLKLVSYPPVHSHLATASGEALQGVGAHTDSNFMTLICQDSRSSGLQVQNVHGGWIDVPPTEPNTLVCNIGELSEIWSNGYFLATPHRVLRHSSNTHSRTSIPIFYNPRLDTVIKPMNTDGLLWERREQKQWRRGSNKLFGSVGENSFKSLARSHPKVFQRHHSDLRLLADGGIAVPREANTTDSL